MLSHLKVAHVIQDEKFPDSTYEIFEKIIPGRNVYFLPTRTGALKHLKIIKPVRISYYSFLNKKFIDGLSAYDAVILHGLTDFSAEVVARSNPGVLFIWIGMGRDYYGLIYRDPRDMLKPETMQIFDRLEKKIKINALATAKKIIKKVVFPNQDRKELIKRINFFAPVVEEEYHSLQEMNPESEMKYIDWNYAVTANLLENNNVGTRVSGNNILVGNSATPTNNHVEAFRCLKKALGPRVKNRRFIVPLSYGNEGYKKVVLENGVSVLGDGFFPLTQFMRYEDYIALIASCSVVIMNHKRQQAGANIGAALYMGAKVFLDAANPFFKEYKARGMHIYSIADIERSPGLLNEQLSVEAANMNRSILKEMRGSSAIINKTMSMLLKIDQISK